MKPNPEETRSEMLERWAKAAADLTSDQIEAIEFIFGTEGWTGAKMAQNIRTWAEACRIHDSEA